MRGDHSRYSDVSCACVCLLKDETVCVVEPRTLPEASLCFLACLFAPSLRENESKYCSFACDGAVTREINYNNNYYN